MGKIERTEVFYEKLYFEQEIHIINEKINLAVQNDDGQRYYRLVILKSRRLIPSMRESVDSQLHEIKAELAGRIRKLDSQFHVMGTSVRDIRRLQHKRNVIIMEAASRMDTLIQDRIDTANLRLKRGTFAVGSEEGMDREQANK